VNLKIQEAKTKGGKLALDGKISRKELGCMGN
jgi:hypothetical protein